MSETRALVSETVDRILRDAVDDRLLAGAERGAWPEALWRTVVASGLTGALSAESASLGVGWPEAFDIVAAAGRHCAPLPLPETIAGVWLLCAAGLEPPGGPVTLAATRHGDVTCCGMAPAGGSRVRPRVWPGVGARRTSCSPRPSAQSDTWPAPRLPRASSGWARTWRASRATRSNSARSR
ncbi:MAG: hypothetical protein M5U08_18035 [Burkholderiales bacterium]|nr:hypothetical protein [Burkholderiales bacterium]